MKKRMIPGIVLSGLTVYMAFETVRLYSLMTRPAGTLITDADVGFGLYLFGGLLALSAVLCFRRARRRKPDGKS